MIRASRSAALREPEYYAKQARVLSNLINILGYTVAAFMALGAIFGALNCMYSAIASRQVEIATLRAIGFGGLPVVVSVMIEALLLALLGGAVGGGAGVLLLRRCFPLHAQLQYLFAGGVRFPGDAESVGAGTCVGPEHRRGLAAFSPAIQAARLPVTGVANLVRQGVMVAATMEAIALAILTACPLAIACAGVFC